MLNKNNINDNINDNNININNNINENISINTKAERLNYSQKNDPAFSEGHVNTSPFKQFAAWFANAKNDTNIKEPYAMHVSSIDKNLQPHSRIVLMREFSDKGIVFYTNYQSNKGMDFDFCPNVALLFFWPHLEQQVRIHGHVEKLAFADNQSYFSARPRDSQIAAIASPQSQIIDFDRQVFIQHIEKITDELSHQQTLTCPNHWGGYLINPTYFEFWQGGAARVHDRFSYQKIKNNLDNNINNDDWQINRLAP